MELAGTLSEDHKALNGAYLDVKLGTERLGIDHVAAQLDGDNLNVSGRLECSAAEAFEACCPGLQAAEPMAGPVAGEFNWQGTATAGQGRLLVDLSKTGLSWQGKPLKETGRSGSIEVTGGVAADGWHGRMQFDAGRLRGQADLAGQGWPGQLREGRVYIDDVAALVELAGLDQKVHCTGPATIQLKGCISPDSPTARVAVDLTGDRDFRTRWQEQEGWHNPDGRRAGRPPASRHR